MDRERVDELVREKANEIGAYMAERQLPVHCRPALLGHILFGEATGHFLHAVLGNDLRGACEHADGENQTQLHNYVTVLYNVAPAACWGSPEKRDGWKTRGGYKGLVERDTGRG